MEMVGVSIQEIEQEANLQRQLNHPNIVKLIDTKYSNDRKYIYIMLEYCNSGTIKRWIEQNENVSAEKALDMIR